MRDDESVGQSLEDPPASEAAPLVVPDAEVPDGAGVVEVTGQKIDVGPLLAAERKRVRESTEARVRAEYEPLRQQAGAVSQLQAELQALRSSLTPPAPVVPQVDDAEAETYARRHQLYNTDSQLDLKTAKSIIAEQRSELQRVARQSVDEALTPLRQGEAQRGAHDNFMRIAAAKDEDGNFLFKDPATHPYLLAEWQALQDQPQLQALAEVGDLVAERAYGKYMRSTKRGRAASNGVEREPVRVEAAGGWSQAPYTMSTIEKKLADEAHMTHADFEKRAKTYVKGQPNSLE